jgi:hypothetical protein
MFAISLTLVIFFCTAVLLYQYWRGMLAQRDADGTPAQLRPERPADATPAPPPARAA